MLILGISWSSGTLIGTMWSASDPEPIYKTTMPISCEQVKTFGFLQCPFKARSKCCLCGSSNKNIDFFSAKA